MSVRAMMSLARWLGGDYHRLLDEPLSAIALRLDIAEQLAKEERERARRTQGD